MIFRTSLCLLLIVLVAQVTECGRSRSRSRNKSKGGNQVIKYKPYTWQTKNNPILTDIQPTTHTRPKHLPRTTPRPTVKPHISTSTRKVIKKGNRLRSSEEDRDRSSVLNRDRGNSSKSDGKKKKPKNKKKISTDLVDSHKSNKTNTSINTKKPITNATVNDVGVSKSNSTLLNSKPFNTTFTDSFEKPGTIYDSNKRKPNSTSTTTHPLLDPAKHERQPPYNPNYQQEGHGTNPAGVQHGQQYQNPAGYGPPASNFDAAQSHNYPHGYQNPQHPQGNVIINNHINNHQQNNYWEHSHPVYTTQDTGSTALGFHLGYSLAKIRTPNYVYHNHYEGDMPKYDHYTVHHYYHNRDNIPKQSVIQPNAIVGCMEDSGALCPTNTASLCTNNGAVMCVANAATTVPCPNNKETNCVRSVVPCKDNKSPECKQASQDTVQILIPCISIAKVNGSVTYVNNSVVIANTTVSNASVSNTTTTVSPSSSTNVTTTPSPVSTNVTVANGTIVDQGPPQMFCVTVLALPAERKLTEDKKSLMDVERIIAPKYVYHNYYNGDMTKYDHYTVHHYYRNRYTVPKESVIQPNAIVGCIGDTETLCPANTTFLCTNNGAVMCVASATSTVPCSNDKDTNCVRSVVSCKNNYRPKCKHASQDSVPIWIPCISTAKVYGSVTYLNNTVVIANVTVSNASVSNTTTTASPSSSTNVTTTQSPVSTNVTVANGTSVDQGPPQMFCVTVLAVPAKRKLIDESLIDFERLFAEFDVERFETFT